MSLQPGTRVGVYEVAGFIGAGGMGEVYRARDTRLARDVAIKLLPLELASDPERLARFDREAQLLASLNHPHIAQIYGLDESSDRRALVMELVEGPTLADVIAAGKLEVSEALRIARQIALALEAAHDRGITHRDLKPANIKLTADGSVKVLDFGLAKLTAPGSSPQATTHGLSASPTLTSPALATGVGVVLGTAAYMSPEQAKGRPVDKRADIWAFGCVLYEMLTGRRAFEGEDVSDTMAAILRADPDWSLVPASVSPAVRQYLRRCLAKDPAQRVRDIGDVGLAIEGAFDVPTEGQQGFASARPRGWKRVVLVASGIAGVAVAAAWLGAAGARLLSSPAPAAVTRLIAPVNGVSLASSQGDGDVAVAPDGSRFAFLNIEQGSLRLYVRALDQPNPVRLDVGGGPRFPFFSPDGAWIGFFDVNTLKRVSVNGGPPITITAVKGIGRGATWSSDGTIVFATSDSTGLMRVPASGGQPAVLTTPAQGEDHVFPEFLPGGKAVILTVSRANLAPSSHQIALLDLGSGTVRILIPGASQARYAGSGHLVYGLDGTLRAVRFDLATLSIRGNGFPVVSRVVTKPTGAANFALASNGILVYEEGDPATSADRTPVWVDRQGHEEPVPGAPKRSYVYPRISPDGRHVAFDIRDQQNDIWNFDLARQALSRLTFDPGFNRGVAWTSDSARIAFSSEVDGGESVYWQPVDQSAPPERLTTASSDRPRVPYGFSRDNKMLLFGEPGQPPFDLLAVDMASRKVVPLLNASFSESNGEVSPDGRWLLYQSDESGSQEIYVRPFPNVRSGARAQVSTGGGTRPAWNPNGREVFYQRGDGAMMAATVDSPPGSSAFSVGTPTMLFTGQYYAVQAGRSYDVSPDGRRFLMLKNNTSQAASPTQLWVVQNWFQELERLVP
jgi:serine/threonine-protein kinase